MGIYYSFIPFKCFHLDKLLSSLNVLFYLYKFKKTPAYSKLDHRADIKMEGISRSYCS